MLLQGVLVYWLSNNVVSLGQVALFKSAKVRKYLNVPDPVKPETTPGLTGSKSMATDDMSMKDKMKAQMDEFRQGE